MLRIKQLESLAEALDDSCKHDDALTEADELRAMPLASWQAKGTAPLKETYRSDSKCGITRFEATTHSPTRVQADEEAQQAVRKTDGSRNCHHASMIVLGDLCNSRTPFDCRHGSNTQKWSASG